MNREGRNFILSPGEIAWGRGKPPLSGPHVENISVQISQAEARRHLALQQANWTGAALPAQTQLRAEQEKNSILWSEAGRWTGRETMSAYSVGRRLHSRPQPTFSFGVYVQRLRPMETTRNFFTSSVCLEEIRQRRRWLKCRGFGVHKYKRI